MERTEHRRADRADRKTAPAARQAAVLRDTGWADQTSGGGGARAPGEEGVPAGRTRQHLPKTSRVVLEENKAKGA